MLAITNLLLHGVDEPNIVHGNSLTHNVLDYTEADAFDKILMNPPYGGSEKRMYKVIFQRIWQGQKRRISSCLLLCID